MPILYGTATSPFVRRVRVVARELGAALDLRNTREAPTMAEMRAISPIWKVPVLVRDDGSPVFDSRAIVDELTRGGWGPLRPPVRDEINVCNVVDAVTDSIINRFALTGEVDVDGSAYLRKQRDRAIASLGWLADRVRGPWLTDTDGFGPAELALVTTLEWLRFRELSPVDDPRLNTFAAHHAERPSLVATRPDGALV